MRVYLEIIFSIVKYIYIYIYLYMRSDSRVSGIKE